MVPDRNRPQKACDPNQNRPKGKSAPITRRRLFRLSAGGGILMTGILFGIVAVTVSVAAAAHDAAPKDYAIGMAVLFATFLCIALVLAFYPIAGLLFLNRMEKRLSLDFSRDMAGKQIPRAGIYSDAQWFIAVSGVYLHVLHRDCLNKHIPPEVKLTRDQWRFVVRVTLADGETRKMYFLGLDPRAVRAFMDWHKAIRGRENASC